jgi:hypothetical protein
MASRACLARERVCICVRGGLSSPDYVSGLAYKPAMCIASLRFYDNRGAGAKLPETRYIVAVAGLPANVSRLR